MNLSPDLTDLSLERLRRRRSAKWRQYPDDVLPAWVAEMDFPLAPPVKQALREAIEVDDLGYPDPQDLGAAFAEFAERRHGWRPEPASVSPAPDVVGAITSVLRALASPGDRVVVNTPVYHPFFAVIEEAGCELAEAPLVEGGLDPEAIDREFAAGPWR
ncbi:MAG TPA: aminotransferase class I/II-fold pyridoxal phosphate-dependent enzyme [Allosphingosinicella sp.]